jgi:hypothetical protein
MMNLWAMVSIATERERQQRASCQEALRHWAAGEPFRPTYAGQSVFEHFQASAHRNQVAGSWQTSEPRAPPALTPQERVSPHSVLSKPHPWAASLSGPAANVARPLRSPSKRELRRMVFSFDGPSFWWSHSAFPSKPVRQRIRSSGEPRSDFDCTGGEKGGAAVTCCFQFCSADIPQLELRPLPGTPRHALGAAAPWSAGPSLTGLRSLQPDLALDLSSSERAGAGDVSKFQE